jgi:hypothetical protein
LLGSTPGNSQLPQARIRPYASVGQAEMASRLRATELFASGQLWLTMARDL